MKRKRKKKHPVRKLFMSLVALLLCTLFAVCAFFGVKGYQMYQRAVEEQPINERAEEIRSMDGYQINVICGRRKHHHAAACQKFALYTG